MPRFLSVRPSVCLVSLDQNSNCNSGVKSVNHVTGRCALFNVKLHFCNLCGESLLPGPKFKKKMHIAQ